MKNLNKILIIPIILACSIFGVSLADNSDCWKFGILSYKNWFDIVNTYWETNSYNLTKFLSIEEQRTIITKNDLNTAILNLKKYCCENEIWWLEQTLPTCENDKVFFNDNALDSPYLFDHIFDVIMRRLNWLSGDTNIYTKTNMTLDGKWIERRNFITNQATSTKWSNPQIIIDKFKKLRTQSSSDLGYDISQNINDIFLRSDEDDESLLKYVNWEGKGESLTVANAMKNYSWWTLYDRYLNACALSEYFYALLNIWANSEDRGRTINRLSKGSCDEIVKNQIKWESSYVSLIEQRSSNLFLSNYIEWYKSYLYERQEKFQNLLKDSKNRRLDVIRAIPGLQRQCTK